MTHLKHALRQLVLRPGLSAMVIVMLALGLGATTAMFSLFHQVLMQPVPVPEPERLVNLSAPGPIRPGGVRSGDAVRDFRATFSYPMFHDLEARQSVLTGLAGHRDFEANLTYGDRTEVRHGLLVSGSYFGVLNLEPALGRLIGPRDEPAVGESAVAVLGYDYWQRQFGGDPSVIDRTLTVNGRELTVIGVAPDGFMGTMLGWRPDVFVPLTLRWVMQPTAPRDAEVRNSYWLFLFGRLGPGVTIEQASAALNGLYRGINAELEVPLLTAMPDEQKTQFINQPLVLESGARGQSYVPGVASDPLTLLLGVTALVLLIVCVNIANLLLARGASRAGEMAIRASVGASRGRLMIQLVAESAVLAVAGGLASVPVAAVTLTLVTSMLPEQIATGLAIELDVTAMVFAAGASLATVVLFGLAPAWQTSATDPGSVVKAQTAGSSGSRGANRFRRWLGTAQIAFSMLLLALAGLFAQSLANVARVDLGIDIDSLATFTVSPRLNGYGADEVAALYDRIEEALANQPGIDAVASAGMPLIAGNGMMFFLSVPGFEDAPGQDRASQSNVVSPEFFETLSIPLLAGRGFAGSDTESFANAFLFAPNVAIVNESFARRFNLESPVGTRFRIPFVVDTDIEIVGVVADAKYYGVKRDLEPQFYFPGRHFVDDTSLSFYVRGGVDADTLVGMIPRVIADIDPTLPISDLVTMRRQVENNVYLDRMITMLSSGFAALATLLAAIGLYGVLAYNVAQRTRELGLRLALGAAPGNLRAMVLKQVGRMTVIGIALGVVAAIALGRVAETLLFGLSGYEPSVLIAAAAVLSMVVFAAAYLPARRASSIAPMEALRYE
jgi:putative ABC transport system permease protein